MTDNIIVPKALLEQALEALCYCATAGIRLANVSDSITELRATLATAEKAEPVAWKFGLRSHSVVAS